MRSDVEHFQCSIENGIARVSRTSVACVSPWLAVAGGTRVAVAGGNRVAVAGGSRCAPFSCAPALSACTNYQWLTKINATARSPFSG